MPEQASGLRCRLWTERQLNLLLPQVSQHPAYTPQSRELFENQAHYVLHLLVEIQLQATLGAENVAWWGLSHPFAPPTAIQTPGLHALLKLMQLDSSHEAFDSQDQTIIEIMRMIQAVLIGQQGVKPSTELDQAATSFIFTGQTVNLKTEHQSNMIEGNLGQQPSKIVAAMRGEAGTPLIAVQHENAFLRPTPCQGTLPKIRLNFGRFFVL
jgi:hypothetical protein